MNQKGSIQLNEYIWFNLAIKTTSKELSSQSMFRLASLIRQPVVEQMFIRGLGWNIEQVLHLYYLAIDSGSKELGMANILIKWGAKELSYPPKLSNKDLNWIPFAGGQWSKQFRIQRLWFEPIPLMSVQ